MVPRVQAHPAHSQALVHSECLLTVLCAPPALLLVSLHLAPLSVVPFLVLTHALVVIVFDCDGTPCLPLGYCSFLAYIGQWRHQVSTMSLQDSASGLCLPWIWVGDPLHCDCSSVFVLPIKLGSHYPWSIEVPVVSELWAEAFCICGPEISGLDLCQLPRSACSSSQAVHGTQTVQHLCTS